MLKSLFNSVIIMPKKLDVFQAFFFLENDAGRWLVILFFEYFCLLK